MQRKTALWQCLYEHVLPSRWQPSLAGARALSPSTSGSLGGQPASPRTRMHIPTSPLQNESVSGKAQNLSHHVRPCKGVPRPPRGKGESGIPDTSPPGSEKRLVPAGRWTQSCSRRAHQFSRQVSRHCSR